MKQITVPFVLSTISIFDGVDKNIYSSVSVDDIKESKKAVDCLCDYGHEKIGNPHVFVTSGYGFWGIPMRLGSQSEVIIIDVKGK